MNFRHTTRVTIAIKDYSLGTVVVVVVVLVVTLFILNAIEVYCTTV